MIMPKIYVLGMGPGAKEYILPVTLKKIKQCHILIGGKRNLKHFKDLNKELRYLEADLDGIISFVKGQEENKVIGFLLSGDTGFYSMLSFLKRHFPKEDLEVIPGISSIQYLAAKLGETWQDAYLDSLHGKDFDLIEAVKKHENVIILTDHKNSPKNIAKKLLQHGLTDKCLVIGENLSYPNEKIIFGKPMEILGMQDMGMSVVMIKDEG
jgi:cobalt-precorrin-7 (C5)-methyltransferase